MTHAVVSFQPVQNVDKFVRPTGQSTTSSVMSECWYRCVVICPFVKRGSQHTSALKTENSYHLSIYVHRKPASHLQYTTERVLNRIRCERALTIHVYFVHD